jgi:hypothetical protein
MHSHTSPRLPGVPVLKANATGSEYSRWRRSVKFALETKDTWKYCDGTNKMPMPDARPASSALVAINQKTKHIQPSLLDERRAWVRRDREELFEVGPPLPPSNLNAQNMLEMLDERFDVFSFEAYHHAFCHFLNLHVDQYTSIAEFNKEFAAVLEDLLDYGHALSNTQACSAYFSKLRCTQNPWVAKRLEEWDAQSSQPEIHDLMQESPPWSCIRPLATKPSQTFQAGATPEEHLEDSSGQSDIDAAPSDTSTESGSFSHSRQISSSTTRSQEIIVHASTEDITALNPDALREALEKLPAEANQHLSSKAYTPMVTESATPAWLNAKQSISPTSFFDRPLPPLPPQSHQKPDTESRARSASPRLPISVFRNPSQTSLTTPTSNVRPHTADPASTPTTPSSQLQLESTHPVLRPRSQTLVSTPPPLSDHPAFRNASSSSTTQLPHIALAQRPLTARPSIRSSIAPYRTVFPTLESPIYNISSSPSLGLVVPHSTPDLESKWSDSTRTTLHYSKSSHGSDILSQSAPLLQHAFAHSVRSSSSSMISLPLQGTRDSAWYYMDDGEDNYTPRNHSVSPIQSELSRSFQVNVGKERKERESITALPPLPPFCFEGKKAQQTPTFDDIITPTPYPQTTPPPSSHPSTTSLLSKMARHRKSSSLDFATRVSGESLFESSDEVREREKKRERKGKGWSIGVNIARFTHSKGVKEII